LTHNLALSPVSLMYLIKLGHNECRLRSAVRSGAERAEALLSSASLQFEGRLSMPSVDRATARVSTCTRQGLASEADFPVRQLAALFFNHILITTTLIIFASLVIIPEKYYLCKID